MPNEESLGGPHVTAALFCEKVLQEKDGVISAIRIVERITATASGPNPSQQMPAVQLHLFALISLKSGDVKGSHTVYVQAIEPSAFRLPKVGLPVFLEGEERGVNLIFDLNFQARQEGLHWFDVFFNDEFLTRIPLRVVYQRLETGQSGGTPVH